MNKPFKVEVLPHQPQWRDAFAAESQQVVNALGENVVAIHHIGSTAIPNIMDGKDDFIKTIDRKAAE
ncbi:MAG TPA: GrpB family protein [Coleofasciculaceae cyanobacterium]